MNFWFGFDAGFIEISLAFGMLALPAPGKPQRFSMLRHGCHLEFPVPEKDVPGVWLALSHHESVRDSTPSSEGSKVIGHGPARLTRVGVTIVRCGGEEVGEAFPDSQRTRITGAKLSGVKWLLRGLQNSGSRSREIECGSWDSAPIAVENRRDLMRAGRFRGEEFTFGRAESQSGSTEKGESFEFRFNDRKQTLARAGQFDSVRICFVGDLDGDAKPDLILGIEGEKGSLDDILFLSSLAGTNELVGEACRMHEVGE